MPWLKFDEKQLGEIKKMFERLVSMAERIATEMKRGNDLKEKESQTKEV